MARRRGLLPYELAKAAQRSSAGGENDVTLGPAWGKLDPAEPRNPALKNVLGWLAGACLAGSVALLAFAAGRRGAERPDATPNESALNDLEQVRRQTPLGYEQLTVDRGALSPGRSASLEKPKP